MLSHEAITSGVLGLEQTDSFVAKGMMTAPNQSEGVSRHPPAIRVAVVCIRKDSLGPFTPQLLDLEQHEPQGKLEGCGRKHHTYLQLS